jgi:hypothetical protein
LKGLGAYLGRRSQGRNLGCRPSTGEILVIRLVWLFSSVTVCEKGWGGEADKSGQEVLPELQEVSGGPGCHENLKKPMSCLCAIGGKSG